MSLRVSGGAGGVEERGGAGFHSTTPCSLPCTSPQLLQALDTTIYFSPWTSGHTILTRIGSTGRLWTLSHRAHCSGAGGKPQRRCATIPHITGRRRKLAHKGRSHILCMFEFLHAVQASAGFCLLP
eukprot:350415-Chlamydomonas_euryale.AAC.7